ncbi:SRPBCC family protein [Pseudoalteromonas luteoviolacea]|uniref:type II toxin-antitoxin system RatA family toxin n=1 Tax=Pseudoalteromonas luteoviolacea TaxID=43657 RepID=UPI001B398D38|nr:SRPBCC family protein [Pseudoalteromonas luteoviolacea]MBQ4810814.1 SRPBCC family protein [Pseudoalteromonas luteoviolacea]
MRQVNYTQTVAASAQVAFEKIADFKSFESHCQAVISVDVKAISDNESESTWLVHFHDGKMSWSERDIFDAQALTIDFVQIEGDADVFEGRWTIETVNESESKVTFDARFCMGIPTLADILEPIAESAIKQNVEQMLSELFTSNDKAVA